MTRHFFSKLKYGVLRGIRRKHLNLDHTRLHQGNVDKYFPAQIFTETTARGLSKRNSPYNLYCNFRNLRQSFKKIKMYCWRPKYNFKEMLSVYFKQLKFYLKGVSEQRLNLIYRKVLNRRFNIKGLNDLIGKNTKGKLKSMTRNLIIRNRQKKKLFKFFVRQKLVRIEIKFFKRFKIKKQIELRRFKKFKFQNFKVKSYATKLSYFFNICLRSASFVSNLFSYYNCTDAKTITDKHINNEKFFLNNNNVSELLRFYSNDKRYMKRSFKFHIKSFIKYEESSFLNNLFIPRNFFKMVRFIRIPTKLMGIKKESINNTTTAFYEIYSLFFNNCGLRTNNHLCVLPFISQRKNFIFFIQNKTLNA